MIIPWAELLPRYGLKPTGVVHAGGHFGQEGERYQQYGIDEVLWIEADGDLLPTLKANVEPLGQRVVQACVSDVAGKEVSFHVTENAAGDNHGQSSSMLDLEYHLISSPDVFVDHDVPMITTTLDDVMAEHWPDAPDGLALNMDIQCSELLALKGGVKTLAKCDFAYLECNIESQYVGCGLLPEVEEFLNVHGFEVVEVELAGCQKRDCSDGGSPRWTGWGDLVSRRVPNPRSFAKTRPDLWDSWYGARTPRAQALERAAQRKASSHRTNVRRVGR